MNYVIRLFVYIFVLYMYLMFNLSFISPKNKE